MRKNGDGSPQKSTATSDGVVLRSARSSFRALSNCLRMISSGASTVARSAALAVSSAVNQDGESLHEQVLWAGFDTLEKEDGYTRRVLLLAFRSGFQVWDVEDKENVHLIVSGHDGQAFFMQMVPKPMHSLDDRFSESRPLLAVCGDSSWEENSSGRSSSESSDNPTNVYAYSLKSQSYVHTLKFRSTVYTVRCSSRIVAVLQAAQIHCFDATTLEMDYTIVTNSIVCSFLGVGYGPLAVGPRWIAYSGSRIANSTSPVFTPELISLSSSPIVAQFARESSKQLAFLEVLPNPYIPGLKGIGVVNDNVPDADSIGMVIIKDIISKSVIAQFKAHKSPISALCFDPSGMLLVTASIQGHNINVFRIMPSISTGSDGNTTSFAHLFRLQRGFTNAVIQDISFNSDSNLIVVSSLRGTSHLFEINPEREGNSPIPLSAINKIRSGNSSGGIGITSTFFCCDEQNNKNYYGSVSDDSHKTNLLVFAPSGRMTEYALWADPVGVGHETAAMTVFDFESGLETEGKVAVEPIRRWPMIQNQSRRETKDHHSDIYGSGTTVDSKSKVFPEVVRKQNVEKSWRGTTRVEDKRQLYISEAELQTHLPYQLPLWARRKFRFQEMVLNRNEESCGGGEMEIEGIQTRTIEARTRDLIPVWGYLHSPISQHVTRESAQISSNITQGDQVAPLEGHGAKTDLGVVHKEEESSKSEEEIQELQRWSYIELGVTKLIKILEEEPDQAFGSEQYINLYSTIYDMCTQSTRRNYPKQLYKKYRKVLEVYTNNTVLPSLRKKHGEFLLREFVKRWDNHKIMVGCLSHCFFYLDCYYVLRRSLPTLKEVGLTSFYKLVYQEMQSKAKDVVLTLIQKEREGEQIDRALLKNVIDVFVENGMGEMLKYEKDFESFMLQDTASYYSSKASRWIQEDSCPEYMLKYEECLKKEKERVTHYLHSITEPKLVEKVQNELLVVVAKRLLENEHSGCRALLRDDKVDDLSKMYKLYHTIPQGLEPVADIFKQHITFLIKQAEDAAAAADQGLSTGGVQGQVFIRKVIELHEKYMVYVSVCFQNHTLFHKALNGAFKTFCNKTVAGRSTAELLATFCNNIVKNGGSDEDIEASLENVVNMLDYLTDQDLFAQFYWRKLARRLLSDHNGSDEHEIILFTKLKQKIGSLYPCKMEAMMRDVTLAREIQNASTDYLNLKTRINFTVTVLTTGLWPSYEKSDLNLPTEMVDCVKVFESYYEKRTEKRKLSWIHLLGTCHIIGSFEQKRIELVVSTYQAAVLLLFNDTERLSYTEILQQLKLSHEHLVCVLHSLSCAKYKILLKEPISRTISKTDTFEFNFKFTDRVKKIKVHLPSMDERKKIIQDADRDRRYEIEAAVVRIMKNKKVLPHQQLVQECVELLRGSFKPCIAMMNTRIEALISRDYLERDSEDPDVLNYVA